jgi:hypothetical protein
VSHATHFVNEKINEPLYPEIETSDSKTVKDEASDSNTIKDEASDSETLRDEISASNELKNLISTNQLLPQDLLSCESFHIPSAASPACVEQKLFTEEGSYKIEVDSTGNTPFLWDISLSNEVANTPSSVCSLSRPQRKAKSDAITNIKEPKRQRRINKYEIITDSNEFPDYFQYYDFSRWNEGEGSLNMNEEDDRSEYTLCKELISASWVIWSPLSANPYSTVLANVIPLRTRRQHRIIEGVLEPGDKPKPVKTVPKLAATASMLMKGDIKPINALVICQVCTYKSSLIFFF